MTTARSTAPVTPRPALNLDDMPEDIIGRVIDGLDLLDSRRLGCCSPAMEARVRSHSSTSRYAACFAAVPGDEVGRTDSMARHARFMPTGGPVIACTAAALVSVAMGLSGKTPADTMAGLQGSGVALAVALAVALGVALARTSRRLVKKSPIGRHDGPTPQDVHRSLARRVGRAHAACRALEAGGIDDCEATLRLIRCLPAQPALSALPLSDRACFDMGMLALGGPVSPLASGAFDPMITALGEALRERQMTPAQRPHLDEATLFHWFKSNKHFHTARQTFWCIAHHWLSSIFIFPNKSRLRGACHRLELALSLTGAPAHHLDDPSLRHPLPTLAGRLDTMLGGPWRQEFPCINSALAHFDNA